jgi:hypothetical protein
VKADLVKLKLSPADLAPYVDAAGACLGSLTPAAFKTCLSKLSDLQAYKSGQLYTEWLGAQVTFDYYQAKYWVEYQAFTLWDDALGAVSAVKVSNVSVGGSLASASLTVGFTATVGTTTVKPSVSVALGEGKGFASKDDANAVADELERGRREGVPRPPQLWNTGAVTVTTLSPLTGGGFVAKVTAIAVEVCPGGEGGTQIPEGQVDLFVRPVGGQLDLTAPNATAQLNQRGGCEPDTVKFYSAASCSQGAGCCMTMNAHQLQVLPLGGATKTLHGPFMLSARYRGAPMQCSSSTVPGAVNGFRQSTSEEIFVNVP